MKEKVLFICTRNAARSQMAEGYLRARHGERYAVYSAGTAPAEEIDPRAVTVMAEIGVDLSGQEPKALSVYSQQEMDTVVTVCEGGICPMFPWTKTRHPRGVPRPAGHLRERGGGARRVQAGERRDHRVDRRAVRCAGRGGSTRIPEQTILKSRDGDEAEKVTTTEIPTTHI